MKEINDLFIKLFIYLTCLVKFRLPYKKSGHYELKSEIQPYIINKEWVLVYDFISSEDIDIDKILNSNYGDTLLIWSIIYSLQRGLDPTRELDLLTMNICVNHDIFLKTFKLQKYSEYKIELRDSIINDILK